MRLLLSLCLLSLCLLSVGLGPGLRAAEGDEGAPDAVPPAVEDGGPSDTEPPAAEEGADGDAAEEGGDEEPSPADWSLREKASYLHGWVGAFPTQNQKPKPAPLAMVRHFRLDVDKYLLGFTDVLKRRRPKVDLDTLRRVLSTYAQNLQAEHERKKAANLAAGRAFMTEVAQKDDVQVTDSGLAYEVLERGDGPQPTANDTVRVLYTGRLLDGQVFDTTTTEDGPGEPRRFQVDGVIPGWSEGLQLMPVGSRFRFYIPGNLAYHRQNGDIGPFATLVFEVELVGIE